jgi:tellurite resistance-related uncharacterized protein
MERAIAAFEQDDAGDWVALLECFHRQHVRHTPPFRSAPWVLDEQSRSQRVGTSLDCPLCDRAELPDGLEVLRTTETWDEHTLPAGLRRAHRIPNGHWGRLRVEQGALRFRAQTDPVIDVILRAGDVQAIPPGVEHEVDPGDRLRFLVEFLGPDVGR